MARFTKRTEKILRQSGWSPGRQVSHDFGRDWLEHGWPVHDAALSFLREFGEFHILLPERRFFRIAYGRIRKAFAFGSTTYDAEGGFTAELRSELMPFDDATPVGSDRIGWETTFLIEKSGRFIRWLPFEEARDTPFWQLGETPDEALEFLCGGRNKTRPIFLNRK